jgi:hypothetical protein
LCQRDNTALKKLTCIKKLANVENTLGLLDAAFAYLNILHPTDKEKEKAKQAVKTLLKYWREEAGLVYH